MGNRRKVLPESCIRGSLGVTGDESIPHVRVEPREDHVWNHGSSPFDSRHCSTVCPWYNSTHWPVYRMNARSNLPPPACFMRANRASKVGDRALGPGQT